MPPKFSQLSESGVPIKFASREIASTPEFHDRWVGKDAAIVISDLWHGSGVPQKRLAQLLNLMAASPMNADVLAMFQASPAAIKCARKLLDASDGAKVVYDATGTFDAMYPAGSFEWEGEMVDSWKVASQLRYTGPIDIIPEIVVDAYVDSLITTSEDALCHLESDEDDRFWRHREKLDPFTAKRYVDAISCGMISIPSRTDLGITRREFDKDDEVLRKVRSNLSILTTTLGDSKISLPVPENVRTYIEAVSSAKQSASAMRKIWQRALECTPFSLDLGKEKLDEFVHNMDPRAVEAIAEAVGAKQMMDAYMGGVPLEDILA